MSTVTPQLKRELGLWGATLMGLGSIIGTGVFVSIGIGANLAGPAVILAVFLGAIVALCNGLSSAQLAASHPVSGGTYEYGYRYLTPWLGFTAGWMFLVAKSASAATAALGFAGYLLTLLGQDSSRSPWLIPIALMAVVGMTAIVLKGIRRSNAVNTVIVSITLLALGFFILACLPPALQNGTQNLTPFFTAPPAHVLQASALMFVAYTGYGRIATMGEEARNPRETIPKAMILCLGLTMLLYMAVAAVGIGAVGVTGLTGTAPLETAIRQVTGGGGSVVLAVGAITAMLGVLLNLILGLSRVVLAMGRRSDLPRRFAQLNPEQTTPTGAVLAVAGAIALLVLIGNVKTTWSFSAFSVLIYYAITNLAALQLPTQDRLFPTWVSVAGMVFCLLLTLWVEPIIWQVGLGLIAGGLVWHWLRQNHPSSPGS
jgi:basic amino acid/polyamine antiporter, APA family